MKLRIMSDLHLDVNSGYPFRLKDTETFTIICGDISAYFSKTSKWLNRYVKNGVFVAGNHIIYNESKHSLQYLLNQYERHYPLNGSLSFLNDNYKIADDIVFVGGTLWTNYSLYGEETKGMYSWYATRCMNDFRYGQYNSGADVEQEDIRLLRRLQPEDCGNMFKSTVSIIDKVCHRFPDKKIVVVTHHAPSEQSVPNIHKNDQLTPCFASNLENFILSHPNIKLWCHGHIHTSSDYKIGNCRIICNPRGYVKHCEKYNFDKNFVINV